MKIWGTWLLVLAMATTGSGFSPALREIKNENKWWLSSNGYTKGLARMMPVTKMISTSLSDDIRGGRKTQQNEANTVDGKIFKYNHHLVDTVHNIINFIYPETGTKRDFAKFFVLETIDRVPYFAYLSVLHFQETFGVRDITERMRAHYAETDNKSHHLLIMEELGGNDYLIDRAFAQTMACFYFWYAVVLYAVSKEAAYHLCELIEDHTYNMYDKYLIDYGEILKKLPVPKAATKYYIDDNRSLFSAYCQFDDKDSQGINFFNKLKFENLYDVFETVRNDEKEHWKIMCNLVQHGDVRGIKNQTIFGTKSTNNGNDLLEGATA